VLSYFSFAFAKESKQGRPKIAKESFADLSKGYMQKDIGQ